MRDIITTIIVSAIILLNPFRFIDYSDYLTEKLAMNAIAYSVYDDNIPISVVLLDEYSFVGDISWPVGLAYHAYILEKILEHHPRAVFIDYIFIDERNDKGISHFNTVLMKYRNQNIPIYMAHSEKTLPEIAQNDELINFVSPVIIINNTGVPRYEISNDVDTKSAAYKIYNDIFEIKLPNGIMELIWPLPPSKSNCDMEIYNCDYISTNPYSRIIGVAFSGIIDESDPVTTHPIRTTIAYDLLNVYFGTENLINLRRGDIVFYGGSIDYSSDNFTNYIYNNSYSNNISIFMFETPGVYVHAIALYNMIHYGFEYYKTNGIIFNNDKFNLILIYILYISLYKLSVHYFPKLSVFFAISLILIVIIPHYILRISPINIVGLAVIFALHGYGGKLYDTVIDLSARIRGV